MKKVILFILTIFLSTAVLAQNNVNVLEFDGSDDYVRYASDATLERVNSATNYTFEAWVYIPTGAATGGNVYRRTGQFVIYYNTTNRLSIGIDNGSGFSYYHSTNNALSNDEWHHIAIIRNTTLTNYLHMYVDGVDVSSFSLNGYALTSVTNNLYIGNDGNSGHYLNASIDEIRIKNVAVNPSDLNSSKLDIPYTSDANTAALFHFDEGSGSVTTNTASGVDGRLGSSTVGDVAEPTWRAWDYVSGGELPLAPITIDGTFDGESFWGLAKATADGVAGWNSVNCEKLYLAYDNDYIYFSATLTGAASDWNRAGFAINTTSGGGTSDPWGSAVTYGHTKLPDYVLLGRLGSPSDWAEIRTWNSGTTSWDGSGTNVYSSEMNWNVGLTYIEGRISQATLGNPATVDVQFYISGDNDTEHGVFDAVPDDEVMTSWNNPTTLDNYESNIPTPVELTSFTTSKSGNSVILNWETATEVNNYGFDVESSNDNNNWTSIGFVDGHGNSNSPQSYSFVATDGAKYYRLKQVDTDGGFEYSNVVEVEGNLSYKLSQNHPNPFNPSTKINFSIPEAAKVSITIFNALGQEVAELANREFAKGNHSVDFNATNLTSGIYFYRMNSANFSKTMKMMLIK